MSNSPSPDVIADLAPTGTLRAAINVGNPVLAGKDPASGEPRGVSVDLARELARRLDAPIELVTFDTAVKVVDAIKTGNLDIVFLAIDPARAIDIAYSPAYVEIEGVYLVTHDSPVRVNADVDRPGMRVVAIRGSAYDLFLTRTLEHATIVRVAGAAEAIDTFVADGLDVVAGVKQQLEADAKRVGGLRLLDGCFMVIRQAMGTPRAREAGARYLGAFVEEMKRSGFVARALERHGIEGASVAP